MQQLVAFVQETGRYPSRQSRSVSERTLAAWLQRRRQEARTGLLPSAFRDGLAVLPAWQTPPRVEADENRWQERLQSLVRYRAAGHDWPRHKTFVSSEEHELGVWLHSQRCKLRNGQLDVEKADLLDSSAPGWRLGRKRGRRSLIDPNHEEVQTPRNTAVLLQHPEVILRDELLHSAAARQSQNAKGQ
ncbi:helicase associated domain-containing protein [Arthrobacter globiformis]|nr:helicase associated domain-containing protein [Arthrobacter globiformis]